ncbi:MAG: hypothetical protein HYS40_06375 [Gemmatimonadetes bacterium]|nr:hypothetical protein [Gemmatimonadota bacterium]
MKAQHQNTWTMARFLEWAFGPRPVFETAKLVHQAALLAEEVIVRPDDPALRRALLQRVADVRDVADGHFWREEGNTAAALLRTLRGAVDRIELSRRLRAGTYALEEQIRSRLAKAVLLQLRSEMAVAA